MRLKLNEKGKAKINNTREIVNLLQSFLKANPEDADKECLWTICLDGQNRVKDIDMVYMGTARGFTVRPAEVYRVAVQCGAVKVIIAHNHPGGTLEITQEDSVTKHRLKEAGEVLQIHMVDFLIFTAEGRFHSYLA